LFDKNHTHILCERLSIPVSPARKLTTSDSPSTLLADFALPMVLKPTRSYSIDRPGQWGRVYIVETESTLRSALAEIDEPDRYMVETYFEGTGCGISVLANKGEIQQAFQHRRLREGLGAASSYRVSELLDPHMLESCVKIMQEMKHTGVCMFEFRVNDKTGAWILLETNARFWGSMPLPLALGVNFPVMLRDLLVKGKQWPPAAYAPGIRSRNITLDGFNLLKSIPRLKPKTVLPWLSGLADFSMQPARWLAGAEFNDSFAADDLKPGWQEILAILSGRR
jgi:predicted ATP-grasp superfamily ATP-dependent carboligase